MKAYKYLFALSILLGTMAAFISCSNDDDDAKGSVNDNVTLNNWTEENNTLYYNYKAYDSYMGKDVIHRLVFNFSGNCSAAYDYVYFDTEEENKSFLSTHSGYKEYRSTQSYATLDGFWGHTKEEVRNAANKGDYTGGSLVKDEEGETEDTPKYTIEDVYGKWGLVRSVGKNKDPYDPTGYVYVSDDDYSDTNNRWIYEFKDDVICYYIERYPEEAETKKFSFNHYGGDHYGISVDGGKVWSKRVLTLTQNTLVLYQEKTIMFNQGYTETFARIE